MWFKITWFSGTQRRESKFEHQIKIWSLDLSYSKLFGFSFKPMTINLRPKVRHRWQTRLAFWGKPWHRSLVGFSKAGYEGPARTSNHYPRECQFQTQNVGFMRRITTEQLADTSKVTTIFARVYIRGIAPINRACNRIVSIKERSQKSN